MEDNKKNIWSDVFINVFSAFAAAIFIGAGVIVWNAASTMDQKINKAKTAINKQQNSITGTQDVLKIELSSLKTKIEILEKKVQTIQNQLSEANRAILNAAQKGEDKIDWPDFPQETIKPPIDENELETKNLNRLDRLLDRYKLK